jgi:hypothetical protein
MLLEFSSHAGAELLQFPPVRGLAIPLATLLSQICRDPVAMDP